MIGMSYGVVIFNKIRTSLKFLTCLMTYCFVFLNYKI